jgi:hypothetical protein
VLFHCFENVFEHFSPLGYRRIAGSGNLALTPKSRGSIPGGKDARARFDLSAAGRISACAVVLDLEIGHAVCVPISHGC